MVKLIGSRPVAQLSKVKTYKDGNKGLELRSDDILPKRQIPIVVYVQKRTFGVFVKKKYLRYKFIQFGDYFKLYLNYIYIFIYLYIHLFLFNFIKKEEKKKRQISRFLHLYPLGFGVFA